MSRFDRPSGTVRSNVMGGIGLGLLFASFYSLYVILLFVRKGSAPFDSLHTTLLTVILTYFSGGITAGAFVGAMRPHTHKRFVAILGGIVAAFFVFLGVAVASSGMPSRWTDANWFSLGLCSLLLGSFGGFWFWNNPID